MSPAARSAANGEPDDFESGSAEDSISDHFGAAFRRLARMLGGESAPPFASSESLMPPSAARICRLFDLTPFESDMLALAAGAELDRRIGRALTANGSSAGLATFDLAFAAFPAGHWDALSPDRPLRRWELVHVEDSRPISSRATVIDEFILMSMCDVNCDDPRLAGVATFERDQSQGIPAAVAVSAAARRIQDGRNVALTGAPHRRGREVATRVSERLGLSGSLLILDPGVLDLGGVELTRVARLVARSALVRGALIVLPVGAETESRNNDSGLRAVVSAFGHVEVPIVVTAEQIRELGDIEIVTISKTGKSRPRETARGAAEGTASVARRIEPEATLYDLVLPAQQREAIDDLLAHARQRVALAKAWGGSRGHGVSALFAGESGTGKSLAAEAIAAELGTALFIVDLGRIVSKYVGETEKNISEVFGQVEDEGGVLLFDEADALFGRRGEVREGMDRYANLEVAHLLTRMEDHRGVAILTTNMSSSIDRAFHRRLDAIITFPMPDAASRELLWSRVFPSTFTVVDLDVSRLARMQLSGATIRSIARRAAVLASDRGVPITTDLIVESALKEYRKLGRSPSGSEVVSG